MKIQISTSRSAKLISDQDLLTLLKGWMFGSGKTRLDLAPKLLAANIPEAYKPGGVVYRQLSLPARLVSKLREDVAAAKPNDVVLNLKPTKLSSWSKRENFAKDFLSERHTTNDSIIILKRNIPTQDVVVSIPAFVKKSSLSRADILQALGLERGVKFLNWTVSEAELVVRNKPELLQIRKRDLHSVQFHQTTGFTGVIAKLKTLRDQYGLKIRKYQDSIVVEPAKYVARSFNLTADGTKVKLRLRSANGTSTDYEGACDKQSIVEYVDFAAKWMTTNARMPASVKNAVKV